MIVPRGIISAYRPRVIRSGPVKRIPDCLGHNTFIESALTLVRTRTRSFDFHSQYSMPPTKQTTNIIVKPRTFLNNRGGMRGHFKSAYASQKPKATSRRIPIIIGARTCALTQG